MFAGRLLVRILTGVGVWYITGLKLTLSLPVNWHETGTYRATDGHSTNGILIRLNKRVV